MRSIATAAEAYAVDNGGVPAANDIDGLAKLVSPTYIKVVPRADQWGTPFLYRYYDAKRYCIISAGADKRFEGSYLRSDPRGNRQRVTVDPAADILFCTGEFVQTPFESQ
jgi:Type II secretion system (T2SS), protein G